MSSKQTGRKWKKLLQDAKTQAKRGLTCLYRQTVMLVEIFDDAEFRADCNLRDDHEAANWFDIEFPNSPLKFLEMRAILEAFPKEQEWRKQSLQDMFASIKPGKPAEAAQRTRKGVKLAEYKAACEERDHYKARAKYLDDQVAELETERDSHRQEIAKLTGRIEELERILTKDTALI